MSFTKCRKASPPPPYSAHMTSDPVRMEPVQLFGHTCVLPISLKQVDIDGYDIVPPVSACYNIFELPESSFYSYDELHDDVAKAIERQYGFPHKRSDARRDFYFKFSAHYMQLSDGEDRAYDMRITSQNWGALRQLLLSNDIDVAGLSVLWWKKTSAQKIADRNEEGGPLCCCVQ